MASKHLATYLNDHLAGSVTAIELLAYLASAYAGSDIAQFATTLREDVIADRKVLEELMERLGVPQSAPRKASAWIVEKMAQLKLRWDDPAGGSFRLFEAMEAVSLGIEGKRVLWRALAAAAQDNAALLGLDYEQLIQRAEAQRERVEPVRIKAAVEALAQGE
jgi:hypothetical protein